MNGSFVVHCNPCPFFEAKLSEMIGEGLKIDVLKSRIG